MKLFPFRQKERLRTGAEERRARLFSLCFLAPSIIGVLVFFVIPFAVVIWYAFIDGSVSRNFVGFDNFVRVWNNAAFRRAAKNTLIVSGLSVPLAVIIPLLLAMALEAKIPMKSRLRTCFLSPMMVPVASVVLVWQVVFHYNGAMNELLNLLSIESIDWLKSQWSQMVIVLLFLWKNIGYNMVLFTAALATIPRDLLEAASIDGAGAFNKFLHVKIRYLAPSVLFVTILSLINSLKIFREVYLLTGGYPYEALYMLQHFMNNTFSSMDYQKLSAAALIMFVFMAAVIGVLFLADNALGKDVED